MAEEYYFLKGLNIEETIRLLIDFIETNHSPHRYDVLRLLYLSEENFSIGQAELALPIKYDRKYKDPIEDFKQRYKTLAKSPIPNGDIPSHYKPLLNVWMNLIDRPPRHIHGLTPRDLKIENGLIEGETLLIIKNPKIDAIELFNKLKVSATYVRLGTFRTLSDDNRYYLFHIRDDEERKSFYQGISLHIEDKIETSCYLVEVNGTAYKFFVSNTIIPDKKMLSYFSRLVMLAPNLFGSQNISENDKVEDILAVAYKTDSTSSGKQGEVFYLGDVRLYDDEIIASQQGFIYYQIPLIESSEDVKENLKRQIPRGTSPESGYRLRLEMAHYPEALTDTELKRYDDLYIEQKKQCIRLTDRLAELKGLKSPGRPILLCFNQSNLEYMAKVLSAYHPNDLRNVLYAYHSPEELSTTNTGEPLHFLYVPSDVYRQLNLALLECQKQTNSKIIFWLDPRWARYYKDRSKVEVFVPYGQLLTPPLHSWAIDDMDTYMKNIMGEIIKEDQIQSPIYFFLELPSSGNGIDHDISISVLDKAKFSAVVDAENIGWINNNLILNRSLKHEHSRSAINDIVNLLRHNAINTTASAKSEESLQIYEEEQARVKGAMVGHMNDMLQQVQDEINTNIINAEGFIKKIIDLNQRLVDMEDLYVTTDTVERQLQAEIKTTRMMIQNVTNKTSDLRKSIEATIENSIKVKREKEAEITNAVQELLDTHKHLENEIRRLKSIL